MSYRPDNQALEPGIEKILEGIKELQSAIGYRQEADGMDSWQDEHLDDLCEIELKLVDIRHDLSKLKKETW